MIIKTFLAQTAAAALKEVRTELGGEAVVLKTRQVVDPQGREQVEITACLDNPTAAQASTALKGQSTEITQKAETRLPNDVFDQSPSPACLSPTHDDRLIAIERKLDLLLGLNAAPTHDLRLNSDHLRKIQVAMKNADVPQSLIESVVVGALESGSEQDQLASAVHEQLCKQLNGIITGELQFKPGDSLLFLGPPGSGKTSLLGKLAALFVVGGQKVKLVSLDDCKVGALDEIQNYAELLGSEVVPTSLTAEDCRDNDDSILLLDSPAFPVQETKINNLSVKANSFNPAYRFVVLSALHNTSDMLSFARRLTPLAPTHLIVTMLDLTERWGAVLAAQQATGLPLVFITDSPSGTGTARTPNATEIADKIFQTEVGRE